MIATALFALLVAIVLYGIAKNDKNIDDIDDYEL